MNKNKEDYADFVSLKARRIIYDNFWAEYVCKNWARYNQKEMIKRFEYILNFAEQRLIEGKHIKYSDKKMDLRFYAQIYSLVQELKETQ